MSGYKVSELAKIVKVVGVRYAPDKSYAVVSVKLNTGNEIYEVYVGGTVSIYFDHNTLKAHVKWRP